MQECTEKYNDNDVKRSFMIWRTSCLTCRDLDPWAVDQNIAVPGTIRTICGPWTSDSSHRMKTTDCKFCLSTACSLLKKTLNQLFYLGVKLYSAGSNVFLECQGLCHEHPKNTQLPQTLQLSTWSATLTSLIFCKQQVFIYNIINC